MRIAKRFLVCASAAALIFGAAPIGALTAPARAQVEIAVTAPIAPPLLPIYAQPPIPGPGYVWIPGYWAWDGQEYYWVPGYWAFPPEANLLWTPGYWAWDNGAYVFYAGYWGPTVGYYGGVDYGFGYTGAGYDGGYWRNNAFFYNRAVNNLAGAQIADTFDRPVSAPAASRVSFTGGKGGTTTKPTAAELAAARERHTPATAEQVRQVQGASRVAALRYSANHGRPSITATQRAGEFHGPGGAAAHPPTAAQAPSVRPEAGNRAEAAPTPPARPQVAQHANAPAMRPQVAQHARAPAMRPQVAQHARAPAMRPQIAQHAGAPAMRPQVAYHAPVARQPFVYHAPMMRQHFAVHAPAAPMRAMPRMGPAHMGGGAPMGGMPRVGAVPHMGGMPRVGGAPHMAGPRVGGGGSHGERRVP